LRPVAVHIGIGLFTAQVPPGSKRTFTQEYREILDMVRLAETLGFDSAWVSEHHGSGDGYMPSLLPTLAALAGATDRIKLGTGVLLTPFHHPLRLAEDAATVDLISGGRLILGLGLAWREEEFRMFAVPLTERVRRTVETIDVLRLAWTGERFSYQGKVFSFDRVKVTPGPERKGEPRVPIWLGGSVEPAMRRAGRIADGYIRTRGGGIDKMREAFQIVEAGARAAGKDPSSMPMAQLQNTFVWEDGDAWEIAGKYVPNQLGIYGGWDAGGDTPEKGYTLAPPDEETVRRLTPVGSAHEVVHALRPIIEAFGRRDFHLIVRLHYPGMDFETASRAIELFGGRVLPALKGA
jgi:probable F420-dependent oxidoreductase